MSNKDKKHNNQFKENSNHGEHRNGRLSQIKNHNAAGGEPNEYLNRKTNEEEHGPNTIN
ncbi:hypothetical protein [Shouchella clausii]|jgi:hypothetical protein|uniref:Uncharacterized protein n=1 Tax=Shouchella clausii (strain KSM-K16) TaxID=66692 RepID=Q5WCB3_SHOC1|nr:hypothetical protein [Shouchella clausii]MCM3310806.1 hypothetical protein [Psychrobacillus sp. MER TA 17]MCR1290233.1 hypothetical protein [Shouchella clausii]MDO7284317.1 hypothetical protein [Shouchella clausii]MDO7304412.1 hypothetical protein [Shouchella clausii]MEB5471253.1 hypothetical protein [Shouchella clausii]